MGEVIVTFNDKTSKTYNCDSFNIKEDFVYLFVSGRARYLIKIDSVVTIEAIQDIKLV